MKAHIGLGSNLGDRRANLGRALDALHAHTRLLQVSPAFESPAVLPESRPDADQSTWDLPFLNLVVEIDFAGTPADLLVLLQRIETDVGRQPGERWAPRVIDLDLLLAGKTRVTSPQLQVPHPRLTGRDFVMAPLAALDAALLLPDGRSALQARRSNSQQLPLWMAIVNLAPDSFSDGGQLTEAQYAPLCDSLDAANVQMIDIGAESTRPGATPVEPAEEWRRLAPFLEFYQKRYTGQWLRPLLSVDTRHAQTAARVLEHGADIINDVSGAQDPAMVDVIRHARCRYVLMHSLSVPADPALTLKSDNISKTIHAWLQVTLDKLDAAGVGRERIIVDPGIGFGKTAAQSFQLLRDIDAFFDLECALLVGHSRKSFMRTFAPADAASRDVESIGISLGLAQRGVDILRVHNAPLHARAYLGQRHATP